MSQKTAPIECLAILVCDDVYRDETTKKLIIVGTFNTIHSPNFPYRHDRLSILVTMTSGRGEYKMIVAIEHASNGAALTEVGGPIRFDNPLHIADVSVQLRNLEFPQPGKYWATLRIDGEIISQRPFMVAGPGDVSAADGPSFEFGPPDRA
jgi:hypothetical protein